MSHDPDVIRRLTQSYRHLRGFEQMPLALVVLGTHSASVLGASWSPVVFVILLTLAIPAMRAIQRYYDRRFGVVEAARWGWGVWAIVFGTFLALQITSNYFALPVQLGFLAAGVGSAVYAVRHFELEGQRLLLAIFFIVVSVWPPILDPREPGELWQHAFAFGFVGVWILMGLWDHRTLVKAFERARLADAGGASMSSR